MPGDLVNEYGDYIGPGASYDSDESLYNDTDVMYLICGEKAGSVEIIGQSAEASYYGNETNKIDKATFTKEIDQCNSFIEDYNKLLKTHCDESNYRYDELKIEEFRI
jgi:PHP family Zn ribbon phosphoesterase